MSKDLASNFEKIVQDVAEAKVNISPTKEHKLNLYGLYKQATEGNVTGQAPSFSQFEKRLKFAAWKKYEHLTKDEAMQKYIDYVHACSK